MAVAIALFTGCATEGGGPGVEPEPEPEPEVEPTPIEPPPGCFASGTLDGMAEPRQILSFGPFVSAHLCLRLDATSNIRIGHFGASSPPVAGTKSGFIFTLTDTTGTLLRDGWDVQFGANARATLEYGIDAGQTRDVILTVRGFDANVTTTVDVTMFEPFE